MPQACTLVWGELASSQSMQLHSPLPEVLPTVFGRLQCTGLAHLLVDCFMFLDTIINGIFFFIRDHFKKKSNFPQFW